MKNDILNALPKSYDELNYQVYLTLIQTMPAEKPDVMEVDEWHQWIMFHYLCVLTGLPKAQLYTLPAIQINQMIDRIKFLSKEPTGSKNTLQLKTADKWTYDDYVNYNRLSVDSFSNALPILKIIVLDKTETALQNLSVNQLYEVFFSLDKSMKKYKIRFLISSLFRVIKVMMKVIKMKTQTMFKRAH